VEVADVGQLLGRFGRLLIIGLSPEPISLGPNAAFGISSHSLLGHLGYDKSHLDQLMGFVASGRLDVSGSISDVVPLEDVVSGGSDWPRRTATQSGC
jgi:threonine dehydrogenase-like Zn-dependent dehydrogenase